MHLTCVVGARPNYMKVAPILEEAARRPDVQTRLVHTGQHYDAAMSALFFDELGLPHPDVCLNVGSDTQAAQTARVMIAFDGALLEQPTDVVVVVGDVNSTLACALVSAKRGIPVAHVEAGLRSGDRAMPEEINRVLTDHLADYLFTTEPSANDNLRAEGIPDSRVHFVGNTMIDTLLRHRERAARSGVLQSLGLERRAYGVCTLHRPSNVDRPSNAVVAVRAVLAMADRLPVVLPMHPRTRTRLEEFGLLRYLCNPRIQITDPLGYLEFIALMDNACVVLTDSGGIQEETTVLGVPCLTFRNNTERPATIAAGTNRLVGTDDRAVAEALDETLREEPGPARVPEMWDGRSALRILDVLMAHTQTAGVQLEDGAAAPMPGSLAAGGRPRCEQFMP